MPKDLTIPKPSFCIAIRGDTFAPKSKILSKIDCLGAAAAAVVFLALPAFVGVDFLLLPPPSLSIPPILNPGKLPEFMESRNPLPNLLTDAALITYSPLESIAGIESLVPVPAPEINPPEA